MIRALGQIRMGGSSSTIGPEVSAVYAVAASGRSVRIGPVDDLEPSFLRTHWGLIVLAVIGYWSITGLFMSTAGRVTGLFVAGGVVAHQEIRAYRRRLLARQNRRHPLPED